MHCLIQIDKAIDCLQSTALLFHELCQENLENVDISSIAKLVQITEKDAYSAVGWLAREDKLQANKENSKESQIKIGLK